MWVFAFGFFSVGAPGSGLWYPGLGVDFSPGLGVDVGRPHLGFPCGLLPLVFSPWVPRVPVCGTRVLGLIFLQPTSIGANPGFPPK